MVPAAIPEAMPPVERPPLRASILICTRNRGNSVVATLESVLASDFADFEVILVDQSSNQDTEQAAASFLANPRFRYIHTATQGKGRALNLGLGEARGEIVTITDDDCRVPPNWLQVMIAAFDNSPRIAVVFCNVVPGPYDEAAGFIPIYIRQGNKIVRTMWDKCRARGIGAGQAVRREAVLAVGGFDENVGPGAVFPACVDGDITIRALINKWWVYETDEVAVIHDGFRTWRQGRDLTKRNWYAIGAVYAKPLKCGHWDMLLVIAYEALIVALWGPVSNILRLKKPRGLRMFLFFCQGFIQGLRTPVDCKRVVYQVDRPA